MSMNMIKLILDGSFQVFDSVFIAAAGAFFWVNVVEHNEATHSLRFVFFIAAAGLCPGECC